MGKSDMTRPFVTRIARRCAALISVTLMALPFPLTRDANAAAESLCAKVKLEIRQEATLERQAFDAHMRINNDLTHITLENIRVDVSFTDENGIAVTATNDPNNTDATFFIRLDTMTNINNVDGTGTVTPSTSADIHWLIIPATGAAKGLEIGTRYYVGARLTYTVGGVQNVTDLTPDHIFVKPLPELTLDYFLPTDVYGDDAFTPQIEPSVPFSLGVRVLNNGKNTAKAMKIDSAQPKIVDNDRGLLIGFAIEGSEVNGQPATKSLLADFGDIKPNGSGIARWIMSCSLSGRFTEFTANYTHADELGGDLTSLINSVNTHFLVKDVFVDLPGRDSIRDFLAKDGDVYRIYESNSSDVVVTDQSTAATLQLFDQTGSSTRYSLAIPPTAGFLFVKLIDPFGGQQIIREVVRSDGKVIKMDNAWLSKTRAADHQTWIYELNLFDANTPGLYTLTFGSGEGVPHPPVLQYIPDRTGVEGQQLSFLVEASDADGTIPALSASPLPAGALFTDGGDGKGIFSWTPGTGQAGQYPITFRAFDGSLEALRTATLTIVPIGDTDNDGLPDAWEMKYFGNLDRDGSGDSDGDGISDLDEFLNGTDPTRDDHAPTVPVIISPLDNTDVETLTPTLTVNNSTDADGQELTYEFELFADAPFTVPVAQQSLAAGSGMTTSWVLPEALADNHLYLWRVRATDGVANSLWAYGNFFVNTANEPPGQFQISSPQNGMMVATKQPSLQVTNATDPDRDQITYGFEIWADAEMTIPVVSVSGIPAGGAGTTIWTPEQADILTDVTGYYWRAVATDEHGAQRFTDISSFLVNTGYQAPTLPIVMSPAIGSETVLQELNLVVANAGGGNGSRQYYYELDKVNTFDSQAKRISGPLAEGTETTVWQVNGLDDHSWYYWRVKAGDGTGESTWAFGQFFVNRQNDPPTAPTLRNPGANAWVASLTPTIEVNPATDPDKDILGYRFEIYADALLTIPAAHVDTTEPRWMMGTPLGNRHRYYWRAQAHDEHGLAGEWSATSSFFVKYEAQSAEAEITVTYAGSVAAGVRVYVFSEAGAYLGIYGDTDAGGKVRITLPNGVGFKFRADILGGQYWSGVVQVSGVGTYPVSLDAGGGQLRLTVREDNQAPIVGVNAYLFNEAGAYLGRQRVSDASGLVEFAVPGGTYKVRVDYLGYQFWSESVPVEGTTERVLTIPHAQVNIMVRGVYQGVTQAIEGIEVYLFSGAGSYLGLHQRTGSSGQVSFRLPQRDYRVRADYLGRQFWSDLFNGQDAAVTVSMADAVVTVGRPGHPVDGVNVYVFSIEGSYLGLVGTTAGGGRVDFRLPAGAYKFRTDYQGRQYWSGDSVLAADQSNPVAISTGGGSFTFTVLKGPAEPLLGVPCYAFTDTGTYLGLSGTTDANGQVGFDLADGRYKFRIDYLGSQFWSDEIQIPTVMSAIKLIAHQSVNVTVAGHLMGDTQPKRNIPLYLFSPAGAYLSVSRTTDENGSAYFNLPEQPYKLRANYLNQEFWSNEFTWQDIHIPVPEGTAYIHVSMAGNDVAGAPVYVYSSGGAYLGISAATNSAGIVEIRLPAGSYKFRADIQGSQYWTSSGIVADGVNGVEINGGGGEFVLTLDKGGTPLTGTRVYVFSAAGSYLGMNAISGAVGQVSFNLPNGNYKFRVDYLGYQFWSEVYIIPDLLVGTLTIPHQDVTVTVEGLYPETEPLAGLNVYLFTSSGTYLGISRVTGTAGRAVFNLPDQNYKVRVDYLGLQFWSAPFRFEDATVEINRGVAQVHVTRAGSDLGGATVYLFSSAGSYLGRYKVTDAGGVVQFVLPSAPFKFRADYGGIQRWSGVITVSAGQDNPVLITMD